MLVFDLESDGLLDELTRIHCINMVDRETGERLRFNDQPHVVTTPPNGTIADALKLLSEADAVAGHNIINFDLAAIKKLYPDFHTNARVHDTLVYARLIWTDLKKLDLDAIRKKKRPPEFEQGCRQGDKNVSCVGRQALEAWGYRLGDYKGDFKGPWDTFTAEMDDYCAQDVEVTVKLLEKIETKGYSDESLELETRVAEIIDLQEKHGVLFDTEAAYKLEAELMALSAELEDKLRAAFDPWYEPETKHGRVVVVDPKRKRSALVALEDGTSYRAHYEPGHPYCKVKLVSFEPGSRDKIADRLTKLFGWEPQELTPTGKPKIDADALDGLVDVPEAALLRDYLVIAKRLGQLSTGKEALLKHVREDGRIHGRVNANGAVTGRMTHSKPNMNVPKVKSNDKGEILYGLPGGYGYEFRALFIVPKRKKLVGVDAEGLELRMLGHYLARYDGGAYVTALVDGNKADGTDVHSLNQKLIKTYSRDGAKRGQYAYLYGAGNWKLGWTLYDDQSPTWRDAFHAKYPPGKERNDRLSRIGAQTRSALESGVTGLGDLQTEVKKRVKSGFLRSLDGRMLRIRSAHGALNTLLQGGGAVVMKKALVIAYDAFTARGWVHGREYAFVLNVHDEFQIEADEDIAEEIGEIAADAIRQAGEYFQLRCPLAGSKDVGANWAQTH